MQAVQEEPEASTVLRLFPTRERDELEAVFNESLTVEYEILSWGAGDATLLLLVNGQVAFRATQVPSILGRLRSLSVICLLSLADPGLCAATWSAARSKLSRQTLRHTLEFVTSIRASTAAATSWPSNSAIGNLVHRRVR